MIRIRVDKVVFHFYFALMTGIQKLQYTVRSDSESCPILLRLFSLNLFHFNICTGTARYQLLDNKAPKPLQIGSENGQLGSENEQLDSKNGQLGSKNGQLGSKNGQLGSENGQLDSKNGQLSSNIWTDRHQLLNF